MPDQHDNLTPLRTEWSTDAVYADPDDREILSLEFAFERVSRHPDIHRGVMRREIYAGPWLAAGGVLPADAGPFIADGCTFTMPSRAEVERQAAHAWWSVTRNRGMSSPDAQAAYREAADDDIAYTPDNPRCCPHADAAGRVCCRPVGHEPAGVHREHPNFGGAEFGETNDHEERS